MKEIAWPRTRLVSIQSVMTDMTTIEIEYPLLSSTHVHYPDRAPLKEVLGGQYNYREGGRQVLRQGA